MSGLGIPSFRFFIGQDSKMLKWRTLTGPEKLKLVSSIDIPSLLPRVPSSETSRIQTLWVSFMELNRRLSKKPEEIADADATEFERSAKDWVRKFIDVYHSDKVTPYMHAMMHHVGEFLRLHGSILPFTQQGLEKYNDAMTKDYFRGTCHRGEEALLQIMQKRNRIEYLQDENAKIPKHHEVSCSNCKAVGHNRWSCIEPCSTCDYIPYRAHLVNVNNNKLPRCQLEDTD